jgi:hypothetical protein
MRPKSESVPNPLHVRALGRWADPFSGFTAPLLTGETCFASQAEARAAWPRCRRAVWRDYRRFSVPAAAEQFDGVTIDSRDVTLDGWGHGKTFRLDAALAAVAADRQNLASFRARDPEGAATISDFLAQLEADLATIEAAARELGAATRFVERPHLSSAQQYGDLPDHARDTRP